MAEGAQVLEMVSGEKIQDNGGAGRGFREGYALGAKRWVEGLSHLGEYEERVSSSPGC